MKKALAVLFAAALALSLSAPAYADDNIALEATGAVVITASSSSSSQPLSNINDGNTSTYWESADSSDSSESVTLTWDNVQSISSIKMLWGGGKPSVGNDSWAGYGSVEYSVDGESWKTLTVSVTRTSNPNDGSGLPFTDDISWTNDALIAKAIRINFAAFQLNGAYQCYEVEVYGSKFEGEIPSDVSSDNTSSEETPSDISSDNASSEIISSATSSEAVTGSQATSSDATSQGEPADEDNGSDALVIILIVGAVLVIAAVVAVIIVKKKKA